VVHRSVVAEYASIFELQFLACDHVIQRIKALLKLVLERMGVPSRNGFFSTSATAQARMIARFSTSSADAGRGARLVRIHCFCRAISLIPTCRS
jgi:hypothetical protein